jgi:molecular chaperone HtpG
LEVILLTDPIDSFMVLGLTTYEGFKVENIASADVEVPEIKADEAKPEDQSAISTNEFTALAERFKAQLGERVSGVRSSTRLSSSVARLVDPEGAINQGMQRVYRLVDQDYKTPVKVLELNPNHPILRSLKDLPEGDELGKAVIEQIYESALLIEGLHPDPAGMIPRIQELMQAALQKKQP